jgi:DNA-3-methyladenine glycosylase
MFGPPGHAYVYFVYGMHWCLNVVTGPSGTAGAVLLRAGRVTAGSDLAKSRRGSTVSDIALARGPATLTQALGIDGQANRTTLLDGSGPLTLTLPVHPMTTQICCGPRVGVDDDRPWRFWLAGDATVSPYRRPTARRGPAPMLY